MICYGKHVMEVKLRNWVIINLTRFLNQDPFVELSIVKMIPFKDETYLCYIRTLYRGVNTLHFSYKNQAVNNI
jgi:pyruvate/oxaloacetate carboxyltransferase